MTCAMASQRAQIGGRKLAHDADDEAVLDGREDRLEDGRLDENS